MPHIKKIKAELLEAASGSKPPESYVRQDDMLDMMITEYFNKASRVPAEQTLEMLAMTTGMVSEGAHALSTAEVRAIINKYAA